jgi:hypothetical protein
MPELPEVETIVRELRQQAMGKTLACVRVIWERSVQGQAAEFKRRLAVYFPVFSDDKRYRKANGLSCYISKKIAGIYYDLTLLFINI